MKKDFWDYMLKVMDENPDVYIISAGLGWPRTDEFAAKYKERFIQVEAAEQSALDISVGLAYADKISFVYTITPFYWRAAETIRTYLSHENLHCILIGAGVKEEYAVHDGFSHSGTDIKDLFNVFPNFKQYYPNDKNELESVIIEAISNKKPAFVNIHK